MGDGIFKTGCNPEPVMQPSCEPYSHEPICCDTPKRLGRPVCPTKFPVPECVPDMRNGCDPCDCVPCFDEDLAMTPEVKAAVVKMLDALLYSMSPVDRCGCDQISQVGHDMPLKPRQKQDPATGEFIWLQTAADGTVTEVTTAINSVNGMPNQPAFDDLCCAADLHHSAFLNNGQSNVRFKGGNPPSLFGGMSGGSVNSAEFHKRVGDLFCCAKAKVEEAPELVVVP